MGEEGCVRVVGMLSGSLVARGGDGAKVIVIGC